MFSSKKIKTVLASGLMLSLLAAGSAFADNRKPVKKNAHHSQNRNINTNKNVNVNTRKHVDVDVDVDRRHHHPVATAVGAAVVVGALVNTLPPSCTVVVYQNVTYQQCGSTWYQPRGTQFIVVNAPY